MKLHFRVDDTEISPHVHFTVFVNGANAGRLCFRIEEFNTLVNILGSHLTVTYMDTENVTAIPTDD